MLDVRWIPWHRGHHPGAHAGVVSTLLILLHLQGAALSPTLVLPFTAPHREETGHEYAVLHKTGRGAALAQARDDAARGAHGHRGAARPGRAHGRGTRGRRGRKREGRGQAGGPHAAMAA